MKTTQNLGVAGLVSLALAFGASADAQTSYDTTIIRGKVPTKDEVINALTPDAQTEDVVLTRGLKVKKKASTTTSSSADSAATTAAAPPPRRKALDLQVNFEFGSFDLTAQAKSALGNLADALSSPKLSRFAFLIEGHTDSVGSAAYNQRLSQQRADSVKNFLVAQYNIPSGRLQAVGHGEEVLLRPHQPASADNRRVQFVNLQ